MNPHEDSETKPAEQEHSQNEVAPEHAKPKSKLTHKHKKLLAIVGTVLSVGLLVGVISYYALQDDAPAPVDDSNSLTGTVADKEILANAGNSLFFQVNNKIIAYDTVKKTPETLTDSLPQQSEVISLYVGADGWRAYYKVSTQPNYETKLYYAENGESKEFASYPNEYISMAANAKLKQAAFGRFPQIKDDGNYADDETATSRTYLVKEANTPDLVFKSEALVSSADNSDYDNVNNALYNLSQMSPDGGKLLFNRYYCYQCDGGTANAYAELDLASQKMTRVDLGSTMSTTSLSYAAEGSDKYYLYEYPESTYAGGMGDYIGFDMKLSKFTDPDKKTLVFQEKNSTWGIVPPFSPDYNFVAIEEYGNPSEWTTLAFKGLYQLKGTAAKNLSQLSFDAPKDMRVSAVSNMRGNCVGLATSTTRAEDYASKYGAGVVCKDAEGYVFSPLAETDYTTGGTYYYSKVL